MIHSNTSVGTGNGSKRKALEMITNIFCKKPKDNENVSFEVNSSPDVHCSNSHVYIPSPSTAQSNDYLTFNEQFLPKSPVSPRVKNVKEDIEALTLSRQDNPYIMQQLEKLSITSNLITDYCLSPQTSPARSFQRMVITTDHSSDREPLVISMDTEDASDECLHEKLIRSPPPNFPQKLNFLFSGGSMDGRSVNGFYPNNSTNGSSDLPVHKLLTPKYSLKNNTDNKLSNRSLSKSDNFDPNLRYERRGSDGSISMSRNYWRGPVYDASLAASSSSLLPK